MHAIRRNDSVDNPPWKTLGGDIRQPPWLVISNDVWFMQHDVQVMRAGCVRCLDLCTPVRCSGWRRNSTLRLSQLTVSENSPTEPSEQEPIFPV
jgi:hypothetical protein